MNTKYLLSTGGFLLALAVILGAFGAHVLEEIISTDRLQTWETAVFYHTWNSLGLLIIGIVQKSYDIDLDYVPKYILAGIALFSGSLYTLCLTGISLLGGVAPIGGVLLILGWSVFGWKMVKLVSSN